MTSSEPLTQSVRTEEEGMRLDRWVKRYIPHLSHSFLEKSLRCKNIHVNGKKAEASLRLKAGDVIFIHPSCFLSAPSSAQTKALMPSVALQKTAGSIASWIVYQDDFFLILNKPQGLATQGGTGLTTSVDQALTLWLASQNKKSYLVHRLDKDTSGLLLVALTPRIATQLGTLLAHKEILKIYWALGVGVLSPSEGRWENWIAKRPGKKGEKMEIVSPQEKDGVQAVCRYRTLEERAGFSFVELTPETGRMHQLRLQMADNGCPILGDGKYGGKQAHPEKRTTLHLHAYSLSFSHPHTQQPFCLTVPLPSHFEKTLKEKGFSEKLFKPKRS